MTNLRSKAKAKHIPFIDQENNPNSKILNLKGGKALPEPF
jgi:hypothetical protein